MTVTLALLHLAALASLVLLPFPVWLRFGLATTIVVSSFISIHRHAMRRAAASIRVLVLNDDGTIHGVKNDGGRFDAKVAGQSTVFHWMVVILLELPGSRRFHPLIILPDALPTEDGRILRAWMRWKLT
ncbi:MAG: hypothetical protein KGZ31_02250 [Sulfuritalea sp.]|nr:hypothetical protein [Sulfuritalea sp.]